jgi:transposase-like protein
MASRRKFTAEFKAQVVLEMLTDHRSAAQLSREYGIKDSVISRWKQEFIERSPALFENGSAEKDEHTQHIAELERLVGRLTLELDAAKKVSKYLDSR